MLSGVPECEARLSEKLIGLIDGSRWSQGDLRIAVASNHVAALRCASRAY